MSADFQARKLHSPSASYLSGRSYTPPISPESLAIMHHWSGNMPGGLKVSLTLPAQLRLPPKMPLAIRAMVLMTAGVFLALLLNLLQVQHRVTQYPNDVRSFFSSAWWVVPCCGGAAVAVGLSYPAIDELFGLPHHLKREWPSVMRCVGVYMGINYASAKLPFVTNIQLSLTLAIMSIGLWWLFDRTARGFIIGMVVAMLGTGVVQLMVYYGVFKHTQPDFFWVRSWFPCILFSGSTCFGNLGRQLAMTPKKVRTE
eukprot:Colp12_sorted_trinity150504_noHs@3388